MRRRHLLPLLAAPAATTSAAYISRSRSDRAAVAADPKHAKLTQRLDGRRSTAIAADGTALAVEELGPEGGPTLILVHGWTCARTFWTLQAQELSQRVRVVTYDLRGHGESEPAASGDYSIEAHARDLQAVLDLVADGERADGLRPVVAGHSLGAMTIAAWAGEQGRGAVGERIAAAALINTGLGDLISESLVLRPPDRLAAVHGAFGRALLNADRPLPSSPNPISHRVIKYVALERSASPAEVAFCERLVLACPHDVRAACGGTLSRLELYEGLADLTVPTAVLAGAEDRLTPPVHARKLAEALPNPERTVILPEAGHMCPVSRPEEVNRLLQGLVADHAGAAAGAGAV